MRYLLCALTLGLTLAACQRATTQLAPPTPDPAAVAPTYDLASGRDSLVAMFEVTLDPATLHAEVAPIRGLASQPPQAIAYDLDIENFLEGDTFRVTGLQQFDDGQVRVFYTHAHPFEAPNLANPITAQNRADLSYTGRLLILANATARPFFSGTVTLDPTLVVDPDGYVAPGDLLATGPYSVTAFPYELLVDETLDNRLGLTNNGDPMGNYNPSLGGWQRGNLGASGDGWTGFDYLHGGQSVQGQFDVVPPAGGPFSFRVAILIKYTDPRGTGNRNFRFPLDPFDTLQFAYRLPFAALDASKVELLNPVDFGNFEGSARTMHLGVRDWDAGATEGADANLSDETNPSFVQPGANGDPSVSIDMPDVSATPFAADPPAGSGLPGDELDYGIDMTNTLNPGVGDYLACARIVDPEDALDDSAYHFGVDPFTVVPTRTPIQLVTYQVLPYTIGGSVPEVLSVTPTGDLGRPGASVTFSVAHTGTSVRWSFGAGAIPRTSTEDAPTVVLDEAGTHFGSVVATSERGDSEPYFFEYLVTTPLFPGLASHSLGQANTVNPVVLIKNDRPAIFWTNAPTSSPITFGRAVTANPMSAFDWSVHILSNATIQNDTVHGPLFAAAVQQDRFVVATNLETLAVAEVAEPAASADWTAYQYDAAVDGGFGPALVALPDRLMVAAYHRGEGGANEEDSRVSFSNVPLPMSAGAWINTVPFSFGGIDPLVTPQALVAYQSGVAWAHMLRDDSGQILYLRTSDITAPLTFEDWDYTGLESFSGNFANPRSLELAVLNDRLHLLYQDNFTINYARARVADPTAPGDWELHETGINLPDLVLGFDMAMLGGRPIAIVGTQGFSPMDPPMRIYLQRALTGGFDSSSDWDRQLISQGFDFVSYPLAPVTAIAVLGDRFHIAYHDRVTDVLTYAISDGAW